MSAPDTELGKRIQRHRGALLGIGGAVAVVVALFLALGTYVFSEGGVPQGAETQIDGRTGAAVENE